MESDILARLEQLRQWQEQQEKILIEKQTAQLILLNAEQKRMYELLGLSSSFVKEIEETQSEQNLSQPQNAKLDVDGDSLNRTSNSIYVKIQDEKRLDHKIYLHETKTKPIAIEQENVESKRVINKKPFLKRGEGLTTRFKVNPDHFKLKNIPKYKFANSHKNLQIKKETKMAKNQKNSGNKQQNELLLSKTLLENDNYLRNEYKNVTKNLDKENNTELKTKLTKTLSISDDKTGEIQKNPQKIEASEPLLTWESVLNSTTRDIEPIKISDLRYTNYFTDDSFEKHNFQEKESEDLVVFQILEKNLEDSSFCSNSSTVKRMLNYNNFPSRRIGCVNKDEFLAQPTDPIALKSDILTSVPLKPLPFQTKNMLLIDETTTTDSSSESATTEDESSTDEIRQKVTRNVRFSDKVQINEVPDNDSDIDSGQSTDAECIDRTLTSTPNEKLEFAQFKANLMDRFKNKNVQNLSSESNNCYDEIIENETISEKELVQIGVINDTEREILEKGELLKERLNELEIEIKEFRKQNTILTKMKQDHELEKIELENLKHEMEEKMNDERIKMEIYFHDERMKINDEKDKYDKLIKEAKIPTKKEREEIKKLKEEIDNLQKEIKNKEAKHGSSQSRLRTQIRNLEKDLKEQGFEIESLKKENKKLETENVRLRRQSNNKMLQEINRNIAKLAPTVSQEDLLEENNKVSKTETINKSERRTVKARVISHRRLKSEVTLPKIRSKSVPDLAGESSELSTDDRLSGDICDSDTSLENDNGDFKSTYFQKSNEQKIITANIPKIQSQQIIQADKSADSLKREINNADGSRDVWYPNGNLKKISADGMVIRMLYYNKDIKETNINEGTVKYYYAETNTWHTSYLDGLEILEFPNGQTEHRYKDGTIEVHFSNGSIRITNPNSEEILEEWRYPDGSTMTHKKNDEKILMLPNGQREVHTKDHKRREYPDGTMKLVYADGSQETRYSNGRVRLKDKDGNLVMDSENLQIRH